MVCWFALVDQHSALHVYFVQYTNKHNSTCKVKIAERAILLRVAKVVKGILFLFLISILYYMDKVQILLI